MLPEEKPCPMPKAMRIRFAKDNPGKYKYAGLTQREYIAQIKWESRTLAEKEAIRNRLKKAREKQKKAV